MWAAASGIPTIVIASATAAIRCPIASHQPARMNQITLPMAEAAPASGRLTSVRRTATV